MAARGRVGHALIIVGAIVPLVLLGWDALRDQLGGNPIETIEHTTGDWTLRFLLASLAVTPLRRLTAWNGVIRYRRTLGLVAFSYACLHFLVYVVLDQGFPLQGGALRYVLQDIAKRPYVTVGFTALLLLVPLAWTSTRASIRRLGGKRWNALHRLVYVAGAFAILHYLWETKGNQPTPVYYALILIGLLGMRVWTERVKRRRSPAQRPSDATAGS